MLSIGCGLCGMRDVGSVTSSNRSGPVVRMADTDPISVQGLNKFVKQLKAIDKDLAKLVRVAFNDAADLVVDEVRPMIPTRTGRARRSVKSASTQTSARVRGGGKRAPYYPWLDFGGFVGVDRSVYRRFYSDGRYIYDAYYRMRDSGRFAEVMTAGLLGVVRKAGFEVD